MTDWATRFYTGASEEPVAWKALLQIFDAIYGADTRSLERYPNSMHAVHASWMDEHGTDHEVSSLDEVEAAYAAKKTYQVMFGGWRAGGRSCQFLYRPGANPPSASVRIQAAPDAVDDMVDAVRAVFPLQRQHVFLSWSGEKARELARGLAEVLRKRVPTGTQVFFSETDIVPGDDPLKTMLDDRLLPAVVQVPVLTQESHTSPWLVWETAAAWALGRKVIPIFVDVEPAQVAGPVATIRQGVHATKAGDLDRLIREVVHALGGQTPSPLDDAELVTLLALC